MGNKVSGVGRESAVGVPASPTATEKADSMRRPCPDLSSQYLLAFTFPQHWLLLLQQDRRGWVFVQNVRQGRGVGGWCRGDLGVSLPPVAAGT
eukprot:3011987-Pleurochrysis_carterae.AAC.1